MTTDDLTTGLLAGLLAVLLLGLAILLPLTCRASSRWSPAVAARLAAAWPDVEAAAPKGRWPIAVCKDDRQPAVVAMDLEDFLELLGQWWRGLDR